MDLGQDVTNITANLSAKIGMQTVKLAGELAKQFLLLLLEKQKERQKTQAGEVPLKRLFKSGEELQTIKIHRSNLEVFRQEAQALGIPYAGILDKEGEEVRIIFKSIQTNLVTQVMKDFVEKSLNRSEATNSKDMLMSALDKVVDIPKLDEDIYRHEVKDIPMEKVKPIVENLKQQGIVSDIAVKAISDNMETGEKDAAATVTFNVAGKDKEKASEIINELKDKTLEELKDIIAEDKESKSKDKTLDEVIKDATDKANERAQDAGEQKNKSKVRSNHEER